MYSLGAWELYRAWGSSGLFKMNKYKHYVLAKINRAINNTVEEWICEVYGKYKLIIEKTKAEDVHYVLINELRDKYFRDLYSNLPKDYKKKVDEEIKRLLKEGHLEKGDKIIDDVLTQQVVITVNEDKSVKI